MPIATPSSAPPSPPAEPQVPFPARFWWLKRLSTVSLLLLLLLGSVRAAWGWEADRRMRDALSAAAARGEPVEVAGLALPDLPDDSNAAWYVRKSADAVDPTGHDSVPRSFGGARRSCDSAFGAEQVQECLEAVGHARPLVRVV